MDYTKEQVEKAIKYLDARATIQNDTPVVVQQPKPVDTPVVVSQPVPFQDRDDIDYSLLMSVSSTKKSVKKSSIEKYRERHINTLQELDTYKSNGVKKLFTKLIARCDKHYKSKSLATYGLAIRDFERYLTTRILKIVKTKVGHATQLMMIKQ